MTQDEFQHRYQDYITTNKSLANQEADSVNIEGIDNDIAIVVDFGPVGFCLMLKSSVDVLVSMGLLPIDESH